MDSPSPPIMPATPPSSRSPPDAEPKTISALLRTQSINIPLTSFLLTPPLLFGLGLIQGGRTTSLRFTAENAHRVPTSTKGWYLYHKTKNYVTALGALKTGARLATTVGIGGVGTFWLLFAGARGGWGVVWDGRQRWKREWEERRGTKTTAIEEDTVEPGDFVPALFAGAAISGLWAARNRLPRVAAARTAKLGLLGGGSMGVFMDVVGVGIDGRKIGWVEWIRGKGQGRD